MLYFINLVSRKIRRYLNRILFSCCFLMIIFILINPAISIPPLGLGDRGPDVYALQKNLAEKGVYSGPVDGVYGRLTQESVKQFQTASNLTADGVVGSETQVFIERRLVFLPEIESLAFLNPNWAFGSVALGATVVAATVVISNEVEKNNDIKIKDLVKVIITYGKFKYEGGFDLGSTISLEIYEESNGPIRSESITLSGNISKTLESLPSGTYKIIVKGERCGKRIRDVERFTI